MTSLAQYRAELATASISHRLTFSDAGDIASARRLDADQSPIGASFKGLPDDQCQCEHMGYVIKGKVAFRSGDDEEVFEAGDAYRVGPVTLRCSTPEPR